MLTEDAEQDDLRGGHSPWFAGARTLPKLRLTENARCDVLVIGAGITGSLVAEHLTAQGLDVCIVDRERPGFGSTAASTAMLLWELDQPLRKLAISHGFDQAAHIVRQCVWAADGLQQLIMELDVACDLRRAPSLYLSAAEVGARELLEEHELRNRAGLPGSFLDHRALASLYRVEREAALVSPGSADLDPVRLAQGLLGIAVRRGARLIDAHAESFDSDPREASIETDCGHVISAKWIVLATGYAMPDFIRSDVHQLASSWAICTSPQQPDALWPEGALIWEASEDYHYARTTADGRIIMGGEDESDIVEPDARDGLIPAKARTLRAELSKLRPHADPRIEFAWSGAFGKTVDGLPMIGRIAGHRRILGAYGYGGNGITFSYLASRIVHDVMTGDEREWFDALSFERDAR